jgi:hypothetical protein
MVGVLGAAQMFARRTNSAGRKKATPGCKKRGKVDNSATGPDPAKRDSDPESAPLVYPSESRKRPPEIGGRFDLVKKKSRLGAYPADLALTRPTSGFDLVKKRVRSAAYPAALALTRPTSGFDLVKRVRSAAYPADLALTRPTWHLPGRPGTYPADLF